MKALRLEYSKEINEIFEANLAEDAKLKRALRESEARVVTATNEKQIAIQEIQKTFAIREKDIKDGLESEITSGKNKVERLSNHISGLEANIKKLMVDIKQKNDSINTLESDKYDQEQKLNFQMKQVEKWSCDYSDLKAKLDTATESLNSYAVNYPELQDRFSSLQSDFTQLLGQKQVVDAALLSTESKLFNTKDNLMTAQQ